MKKEVLFSLCLTAASAVLVTGCATKQEAAAQQAQQEAIEVNEQQTQQLEAEVGAEPSVTPNEATPGTAEGEQPQAQGSTQEQAVAEQTPECVVPPPETASKPKKPVHPQPVPYTVTAGDSVSALSVRFNVRSADILALNPSLRGNPSNLKIGQKVMLPPGTDVSVKPKPRAQKPRAIAGATIYTVKAGDVLGSVARAHGVKVADIKKANNLKNDNIFVGQKLQIPGATKKPTAGAATVKHTAKKPEQKPAKPAQENVAAQPVPPPAQQEEAPVVMAQEGEEALPPPPQPEGPVVSPTDGDAAGVPPPPPPADDEQYTTYVVGEKEDLVNISLKFNVLLSELRAANNLDDSGNNAVAPGTTLRIPKR